MALFGRPKRDPHPWDRDFRIIDLTGREDWLSLSDMFTGIAVFGATGSGKTSALATLAYSLMEMQCGFVWLCAKVDEVNLVRRIAHFAGRSADVVVIGLDIDGEISPHRFNALDYESGIETTGTGSVVQYLSDCAKVLSHKEGEHASGEGERFWTDQFERLLRYCVDTAKFAGRHLSVDLLRRIQLSAPKSQAELDSEEWAASSECWKCVIEANARCDNGEVAEEDIDRIATFWTKDWLSLDAKPKTTIEVMFGVLSDAFYAEEPLRSILTTTTTVTPDDVIDHGKIVVLSLPTNIYHGSGRMGQFCFKYSFQRAMLRRKKPADNSPMRPTVMWVDEAHAFAHSFDARYFAEIRSNRGINVYLEQGIGGYMDALGYSHAEQVDGYLQNLATKIFFNNNSPATNEYAANVIGKTLVSKTSKSSGASGAGFNFGQSVSDEERHKVISGTFVMLKRGGAESGLTVQGVVTIPGKTFTTTGANYSMCHFPQTELTK
jgi:hypothetical protein